MSSDEEAAAATCELTRRPTPRDGNPAGGGEPDEPGLVLLTLPLTPMSQAGPLHITAAAAYLTTRGSGAGARLDSDSV